MKIGGQCHCGNISYVAETDPDSVIICHCTDCQALSASAFRTVCKVRAEDFQLTGNPKIYIKTGASGNKRRQAFCSTCGSAIYAASDDDEPDIYNLRLGTARQRHALVPKAQIWSQSALGWLDVLNNITKIERQ